MYYFSGRSKIILRIPCHHSCLVSGGQAHKRRRTSEPIEIEDRLESLICRVGEKVMKHGSKSWQVFMHVLCLYNLSRQNWYKSV